MRSTASDNTYFQHFIQFQCVCRNLILDDTYSMEPQSSKDTPMRQQHNISSNDNQIEIQTNRMKRNLFDAQSMTNTKDMNGAVAFGEGIMKRLSSMVPFGKSQPEKPATYCTISHTMSNTDDTTNAQNSPSYQSSGSYTSSNSSSSSSSSFSSSDNENNTSEQHQSHETQSPPAFASTEAPSSPSNTVTSPGGSSTSSSSSSSTSSSSSANEQSSDDDKLPTNADYYPLTQSETQSNDDFNDSEQYDVESAINADKHKELWINLMNAPHHFVQKMQKIHADFKGQGPLYGSDHFAKQPNKT